MFGIAAAIKSIDVVHCSQSVKKRVLLYVTTALRV